MKPKLFFTILFATCLVQAAKSQDNSPKHSKLSVADSLLLIQARYESDSILLARAKQAKARAIADSIKVVSDSLALAPAKAKFELFEKNERRISISALGGANIPLATWLNNRSIYIPKEYAFGYHYGIAGTIKIANWSNPSYKSIIGFSLQLNAQA